ncbi:hypothetical protein DENIS_1611 [Desulfonema ishimotonii]|uniref:Uncharacterized protein n=1 Tax=Desulfonema ishimotonii TaxID=45657 RepID=A0A401FUN1_9BACT|nr:hypothetical protein DENIS_1611 [Desulfonema ishimotonii]
MLLQRNAVYFLQLVSILVLMEVAQESRLFSPERAGYAVSILVLMEVAQECGGIGAGELALLVSILVLMEVAQEF